MKRTNAVMALSFVFTLIFSLTSVQTVLSETSFPTKPITLFVGFPAGGSTDTIARAVSAESKRICGQKMLVVNKVGAGGAVAMTQLKGMKPDGYNLMINTDTPVTRVPHLRKLAFDPLKDFTYITRIGIYKTGFVVPADSPFKTWADVVKWAKAHPNELKYGAPPRGTTPDIAMAVMAKRHGFTYNFVPFTGDAKMMAGLLGGHISIAGSALGAFRKYVEAGKVRVLFFYEKVDAFPDVPTAEELGIDVQTPTATLVFGPTGIPADVRKKLGEIFAECTKSKTFRDVAALTELQLIDQPIMGEALDKYILKNYNLYKGYIEEVGLAKK
jgi:tripartite-type tricarboxylate transporter receptor subunit TctC